MVKMIIIYTTIDDEIKAENLARHLLERKLIACANIFPIKSLYNWKGKLEKSNEFVIIIKTLKEKFNLVKEEIEKIHPYEIPCILKINTDANKKFLEWVGNEIKCQQ